MNYIIYGTSTLFEKQLFEQVSSKYRKDSILYIRNEGEFLEVSSIIKYPPFFDPKWLLIIDLVGIGRHNVAKSLMLTKEKHVQFYGRIPVREEFNKPNQELYKMLAGSAIIRQRDDITVLNSLYPSNEYIKSQVFKRLDGIYLSDRALTHVVEVLRHELERIDEVVEELYGYGTTSLSLSDVKKMFPSSRNKSLTNFIYCVLLAHRGDLKQYWEDRDKKILVSSAGTKDKPFTILKDVDLDARSKLNIILAILKRMVKLKKVYQEGNYTTTTIFNEKSDLELQYPFMKSLNIPDIINHTKVFSEVTHDDLLYVLTSFMELKSNPNYVEEDLYFVTTKMMNRHKRKV